MGRFELPTLAGHGSEPCAYAVPPHALSHTLLQKSPSVVTDNFLLKISATPPRAVALRPAQISLCSFVPRAGIEPTSTP